MRNVEATRENEAVGFLNLLVNKLQRRLSLWDFTDQVQLYATDWLPGQINKCCTPQICSAVWHTWNICYIQVITQCVHTIFNQPHHVRYGPCLPMYVRLQLLQQHQLTEKNLGTRLIQHLKHLRCVSVPVSPEIPAEFELRRLRPCTGRKAPSSHQPWFVKAICCWSVCRSYSESILKHPALTGSLFKWRSCQGR